PHKPGSAERLQSAANTPELVKIQNIGCNKRTTRSARIDIIDLSAAHQSIISVALQSFRNRQGAKLLGNLENRMLDSHLGHVGNSDLITPLNSSCRNHRYRHGLPLRRNAFTKRSIRKRQPIPAGSLILNTPSFRQLQWVTKTIGDKPAPSERQGFIGDISFYVGGECG